MRFRGKASRMTLCNRTRLAALVALVFATNVHAATGNLNVTVRNQNGTVIAGATVWRYTTLWSPIDSRTTGSSGVASWTGINTGTYNLEAYYNGEYWVNGSATVSSGATTNATLQRNEPYAFDFKVYSGSTDVTGGSVPLGTALRYEIRVRNSSPVARTNRIRFRADRDQNSPYDYPESISSSQRIGSGGGTATFTFNHTPSFTGTYYRSFETETLVNTTYVKTDSWPWGTAVTVTPTSGTIRLTVNSLSGSTLAVSEMNAVILFTSTGSEVSRKQPPGSNPMDFTNVNFGNYYIDVYCWDMLTKRYSFSHRSPSTAIAPHQDTQKRPLKVTVYYAGGTIPYPGASVYLDSWNGEFDNWTKRANGTAGSDGTHTFSAWPTDSSIGEKYRIRVNNGAGTQVGSRDNVTRPNDSTSVNYPIPTTEPVPGATITITVRNSNSLVRDAVVQMYDNSNPWQYQTSIPTDANGQASFTVPGGRTWNFEVYYVNPTFGSGDNAPPYKPFRDQPEFWGSLEAVSAASGATVGTNFYRWAPTVVADNRWPWLDAVIVRRTDTGAVLAPGESVVAGTQLQFDVRLRNNYGGGSLNAKARLLLDRNKGSPYDQDILASTWAPISSSSEVGFSFTWTPTSTGDYYCVPWAKVRLVNGNEWTSDSWTWSSTPSFKVLPSARQKGITVITHGFQMPILFWRRGEVPNWVFFIASAASKRIGGATVGLYDRSTGSYKEIQYSGNSWSTNDNIGPRTSGETVLIFDWADESDLASTGWAEAAGDALFSSLVQFVGGLARLVDYEWHFIGHSRGAVVNSEAIERFATFAVDVSQMTTLDPHDFDQENVDKDELLRDWELGLPQGITWRDSWGFTTWNNVTYSDNYWSDESSLPEIPEGRDSGSTAWDFNVGANTSSDISHSEVHAWYYGTVDLVATEEEGTSGQNIEAAWYPQGERTTRGWNMTRYASALRPPMNSRLKYSPAWDPLRDAVFNGAFSNAFNAPLQYGLPGWQLHGGGITASARIIAGALALKGIDASVRHNRFYVSGNATHLIFDTMVVNPSIVLRVSMGQSILGSLILTASTTTFENHALAIPLGLRNSVQTLTFEITQAWSQSTDVEELRIDNIRLDAISDTSRPTVIINQAAGQPDPTSSSPVNFTLIFSESVTGFGDRSSDVMLSGTAGATGAISTGSGTTYNIAVSGMMQSGTVVVDIPAGAAQDLAGNDSVASTSADNVVTYVAPNNRPHTPSNISPLDGALGQSLTVILQGNAFSDRDGDTHAASHWQVFDSTGRLVWDSGDDGVHRTSRSVPPGLLDYSMIYGWHVRYKDDRGEWSHYSERTSFTTIASPNGIPIIDPIADIKTNELRRISFLVTARDTDDPPHGLTFSLEPGAPEGAAIGDSSGLFTWRPTETNGPGVYAITVKVTDNGSPPQSATTNFTVIVNEVNRRPGLRIREQWVKATNTLSFEVGYHDGDIPTNVVSYSTIGPVPEGLTVDRNLGIVTWTPTEAQASSNPYRVTIEAFDVSADPIRPSLTNRFTYTIHVLGSRDTLVWPDIRVVGDEIELCWAATVGKRYQVQCTDSATPPNWQPLNAPFTAQSTTACIRTGLSVNRRLYRVIQLD